MKRNNSLPRRVALGGLFTALSVLLMLVGGFIGVATYLAPVMAGVIVEAVRVNCSRSVATIHWLATGLLALILCTDKELAAFYLFLLGWYPLVRPTIAKLPKVLGFVVRFVIFNADVILLVWILFWVLYGGIPRETGSAAAVLNAVGLVMGNIIFFMYDFVLANAEDHLFPRVQGIFRKDKS
jgi:hypothetical protein